MLHTMKAVSFRRSDYETGKDWRSCLSQSFVYCGALGYAAPCRMSGEMMIMRRSNALPFWPTSLLTASRCSPHASPAHSVTPERFPGFTAWMYHIAGFVHLSQ